MKATGTKKRRRKVGDKNPGNKKRKGDDESAIPLQDSTKDDENSQHDSDLEMDAKPAHASSSPSTGQATTPNPRPRPKPRIKPRPSDIDSSPQMADPKPLEDGDPEIAGAPSISQSGPENISLDSERAVTPEVIEPPRKRRNRLVISDSDSD